MLKEMGRWGGRFKLHMEWNQPARRTWENGRRRSRTTPINKEGEERKWGEWQGSFGLKKKTKTKKKPLKGWKWDP